MTTDLVLPANAMAVTSWVTADAQQLTWCVRTEEPHDSANLVLWHSHSTLVSAVDARSQSEVLDRLISEPLFGSILLIGDPKLPVTSDLACATSDVRRGHGVLWDRTGSGDEIGPWLHLRRRGGRFCATPALAIIGVNGLDLVDRRNAIDLFAGLVRASRPLRIAPVIVLTLPDLRDPEWQFIHAAATDFTHLAWRPYPA
jgi:hypothetical protein